MNPPPEGIVQILLDSVVIGSKRRRDTVRQVWRS
jgi:hypothetical protein